MVSECDTGAQGPRDGLDCPLQVLLAFIFMAFRYLDLTLAAYVGEDVVVRYYPGELGEIRVFHRDKFLCRAICAELAGETIGLKDIISGP